MSDEPANTFTSIPDPPITLDGLRQTVAEFRREVAQALLIDGEALIAGPTNYASTFAADEVFRRRFDRDRGMPVIMDPRRILVNGLWDAEPPEPPMTEAEWFAGDDPRRMLWWLERTQPQERFRRKLVQFVAAFPDGSWLGKPAWMASVLRDLWGNPFRPIVADPDWLRWQNRTVPRLAAAILERDGFAALPVLTDALEEAGCTNEDLLGHLRAPGPHYRGCWAVELLSEGEE